MGSRQVCYVVKLFYSVMVSLEVIIHANRLTNLKRKFYNGLYSFIYGRSLWNYEGTDDKIFLKKDLKKKKKNVKRFFTDEGVRFSIRITYRENCNHSRRGDVWKETSPKENCHNDEKNKYKKKRDRQSTETNKIYLEKGSDRCKGECRKKWL